MPNSPTSSKPMALHPEDFDPPLKRSKPTVPYYWTVDELAKELEVTIRKVQYDIKGQPQHNIPPKLKAYQAGMAFLIPESDALEYLWQHRQRKRKS